MIRTESFKVGTEFYNKIIAEEEKYQACCPEYIKQAKKFLSKKITEFKNIDELGLELFYKALVIKIEGELINGNPFKKVIIEKNK